MKRVEAIKFIEDFVKKQGYQTKTHMSTDRFDVVIQKKTEKAVHDLGSVTIRISNLDGEGKSIQDYLRAKTLDALNSAMKEHKANA